MPVYAGVTYILAAPIINPVVYASTFMAFRTQPELVYSRMGLAFAVSAIIGFTIYKTVKNNPLRLSGATTAAIGHHHNHEHIHQHHDHGHHHEHIHQHKHDHKHDHNHAQNHGGQNKLSATLSHASDEFFEMGKYLMFGAMLTAVIQTSISRETLVGLDNGLLGGSLFMAGFAYLLSLCSTSDAFVAASFTTTFSKSALLTFLVFGPMLDLKNTLMLLSVFKTKFVVYLIILITTAVLAGTYAVNKLGLLN
jgi:hypothetical protein